jgi:enoyl-CoA hydratase/carnithine racemase
MHERVRIDVDARGIADVCLARGDKMNALDFAMFDALAAAIDRLKADPQLRAVVLHGEGKAFCAGLDTSRFAKMSEGGAGGFRDLRPRTHGASNSAQYVAIGWRELAVPVIAAVHGVAFGGGLQIALGADVRLVGPDAKLSVMEVKWGLVPDMGGIALLRGLVRGDVARELVFTGRVVRGDEAVAIGLATRVCPDPLQSARELAGEIVIRSPDALAQAKALLNRAQDEDSARLLQAESDAQTAVMGSANQIEAVRANLELRAPVYAPRSGG